MHYLLKLDFFVQGTMTMLAILLASLTTAAAFSHATAPTRAYSLKMGFQNELGAQVNASQTFCSVAKLIASI